MNKCLSYLGLLSLAAGMNLNMHKSVLIDLTVGKFDALIWPRQRILKGNVFKYLGYPMGVDVTNQQLLKWVMDKVNTKIVAWYCDEWPLHVRLRILQSILIPYLLYYLSLLN